MCNPVLVVIASTALSLSCVLCALTAHAQAEAAPAAETDTAPAEPETEAAEPAPTELDGLRGLLLSPDVAVRVRAIQELTARGDRQSVAALARISRRDPTPFARGWALRAVAALDPDATQVVRHALLNDADPRIRDLAAQLLRLPSRPSEQAEQEQLRQEQAERRARAGIARRRAQRLELAYSARRRARIGFTLFTSGLAVGIAGLAVLDADEELGASLLTIGMVTWLVDTPFMLTAFGRTQRVGSGRSRAAVIAGTVALGLAVFASVGHVVSIMTADADTAMRWGAFNGIISPTARLFTVIVGSAAAVRADRQIRAFERH